MPKYRKAELVAVSLRLDHVVDGGDGQSRADAKTHGRKARRKTAPVGKPFQRVADTGTIDSGRPHPAYGSGQIKVLQAPGIGIQHPGSAHKHTARHNEESRPKLIDGIALEGDKPGFEKHKDRESVLQRPLVEMILAGNWIDEQSPAILQIRNHRHADNADDKLKPAAYTHARLLHDGRAVLIHFSVHIPPLLCSFLFNISGNGYCFRQACKIARSSRAIIRLR